MTSTRVPPLDFALASWCEDRQREGGGLARACLRDTDHIRARDHRWNSRRRMGVGSVYPASWNSLQNEGIETEGFEGHPSPLRLEMAKCEGLCLRPPRPTWSSSCPANMRKLAALPEMTCAG